MEKTPTLEELMQIELGFAAYADDCVYVCPASASEYDNSVYRVDKDSHAVTPMFFTEYVVSDDSDPEKVLSGDLSKIWDYLQ